MSITSSIAIVTGASKGLGAAVCIALVENGVKVYGIARSGDLLQKLQNQLGESFIPVSLDITNREKVMQWIKDEFHDDLPNILINNAGAGSFSKIDEMPEEEWDKMIDTNLHGMYNITVPVISLMKKRAVGGYIINIGSILGTTTRAEGAAYSATKYAIRGFSESLMKELRGDNIKVTCINPGSIDTHFFENSRIESHPNMLQPDELAKTIVFLLKTPENFLIDELTIRPLDSRNPKNIR